MRDTLQTKATHSGIVNLSGFTFRCYVLSDATSCLNFIKHTLIPREVIEKMSDKAHPTHDRQTIYRKVKVLDTKSTEYGKYIDMIESNFGEQLIRCGAELVKLPERN